MAVNGGLQLLLVRAIAWIPSFGISSLDRGAWANAVDSQTGNHSGGLVRPDSDFRTKWCLTSRNSFGKTSGRECPRLWLWRFSKEPRNSERFWEKNQRREKNAAGEISERNTRKRTILEKSREKKFANNCLLINSLYRLLRNNSICHFHFLVTFSRWLIGGLYWLVRMLFESISSEASSSKASPSDSVPFSGKFL